MIVETRKGQSAPPETPRRRAEDFSAERAVAAYESLFDTLIERNIGNATDRESE